MILLLLLPRGAQAEEPASALAARARAVREAYERGNDEALGALAVEGRIDAYRVTEVLLGWSPAAARAYAEAVADP
ncbi:MAG: hypothetical protein WBA92_14270, partial [Pseudorhodobacter sp.]